MDHPLTPLINDGPDDTLTDDFTVRRLRDTVAAGWELTAAENVLRQLIADPPFWLPHHRLCLLAAFQRRDDTTWHGPLLDALIVHIAAGMAMAPDLDPTTEEMLAAIGSACPGMRSDQIDDLHEAARARLDGHRRELPDPTQWLPTAAALAAWWISGPEPEQGHAEPRSAEDAIARARPLVDFLWDGVIVPELFHWL
ncbi:hypothetical protein M6B22_13375 [Jatrophihabitans cynanchi]|uniref:Uncharacterized protein n=1 Tax=Jatrophihabitans cynanchi TaxID=2944128 RepID=A0ABY7JWS3_9ACTN|nr:hypothetical protein [Jatrophihabitans sp. SB3-54]WAX55531.1 hypothetical protein M6B22_13375 [Jatrophihabitans sp. SB3-54]